MGRVTAASVVFIAIALTSACGSGGEEAEVINHIGTRVTTSTTTPLTDGIEAPDRTGLLRDLAEGPSETAAPAPSPEPPPAEPEPEVQDSTATAGPPHCFAMEEFVFESTQMMLQDDLGQAVARSNNAIAALDTVISEGPPSMTGPAATLRELVAAAVGAPAATVSVDGFNASVLDMVQSNAGLIDDLYSTTIDVCDVEMSEPIMPSVDGAQRVAGA